MARRLRAEGFDVEDVRDVGLRGHPDGSVFDYAQARSLVILTGDLGFGNVLRFPLGTHRGIVVSRFPNEVSSDILNQAILVALKDIGSDEIEGHLLVIEPGRVRLRRA